MIQALKIVLLFSNILLCIIVLILVRFGFIFSSRRARLMIPFVVYGFGKIFTSILGIKIDITGERELLKSKGVLFVSNHVTYVDGIIATSLAPLVFIARADLRTWPLFGVFSSLSNTIFVERFSRSNVQGDADKIYRYLKEGTNVILYPEGTSADGRELLPFKSSFFMAPLLAQSTIIPLVIKYKKITFGNNYLGCFQWLGKYFYTFPYHKKVNSQNINEANKDLVYWYGDMEFIPHLFKLLALREITVEVKVCKPIEPESVKGENASIKRKFLSDACRLAIEAEL